MSAQNYTFRDAQLRSPLLRTVNSIGSGLAAIGMQLPALSEQGIISAAQEKASTHSQPDELTLEALSQYLGSADADARLNTLGRFAVKDMLTNGLSAQLSVLAWHESHPELAQEKIAKPWIILGLPRTGTSILSILLGLDPFCRPIRQWEAAHPIPPSTLAEAGEDARIAIKSRQFQQLKKMNPAVTTMHPFGSTLAEECTAIMMYSLRTIGMETIAFTPSYGRWLDSADMSPAYSIHKKTLQAFQHTQPAGQWVLKSPNHLWCLPALLEAYPDANIIWTHRDPSKVLPSLASLNCAMQTQFTRRLEPETVGEYWATKIEGGIRSAREFDQSRSNDWCYHLQYRQLMEDPLSALKKIYGHFGKSINELHESRIKAWLSQKPRHADGVHAYDAKDFGWTQDSIHQRFKDYQQQYDVPLES